MKVAILATLIFGCGVASGWILKTLRDLWTKPDSLTIHHNLIDSGDRG